MHFQSKGLWCWSATQDPYTLYHIQTFEHTLLKPQGRGTTWSHRSAVRDRPVPEGLERGGHLDGNHLVKGGGANAAGRSAGHTTRTKMRCNLAPWPPGALGLIPETALHSWGRSQRCRQTSGGFEGRMYACPAHI